MKEKRSHQKQIICEKILQLQEPDHIVADCPYNSDNDEDEKKKHKKDKKKKMMMTFQNKKGGAMWSLGIVMALWIVMALVMMTRNPSRKH